MSFSSSICSMKSATCSFKAVPSIWKRAARPSRVLYTSCCCRSHWKSGSACLQTWQVRFNVLSSAVFPRVFHFFQPTSMLTGSTESLGTRQQRSRTSVCTVTTWEKLTECLKLGLTCSFLKGPVWSFYWPYSFFKGTWTLTSSETFGDIHSITSRAFFW